MKNTIVVLTVISLLLIYIPYFNNTNAQVITITLYPTDDADINQKNPHLNNGMGNKICIRNYFGSVGANWGFEGLVKFNLSSIPKNSTILSATLKLWYAGYNDNNPYGRKLNLYAIISDWNESTVTWNNHPLYAFQLTDYATVPWNTGVWIEWNVTADIQAYVDGNISLYGWKIADETYWGSSNIPITYLSSKEGPHAPCLEIKYKPKPSIVYVDDDYNESTPGWQYDHFNRIQDAINAVAENGTVYVYEGLYKIKSWGIILDKPITLIGKNRSNTIIWGVEIGLSGIIFVKSDFVHIYNFSIFNATTGDGIYVRSNHTTVAHCIISNYGYGNGTRIFGFYTKIIDCEISNCGHGIWIYTDYNEIQNCSIYNNFLGIRVDGSNNRIWNCKIYNNTANARDNNNNIWNISKNSGINIIGGPYLGGNYWDDYAGVDVNGDGLGDTNLPYGPGDWLPLVEPNYAPVAVNDSVTIIEDTIVIINVTTNDYDADDNINYSTINITQWPSYGNVTVYLNGTVKYIPETNYYGIDFFKYRIKDNIGAESNEAWVNITILPINDPPIANNDYIITNEDTLVIIDVLANDTDVEDHIPSLNAILGNPPHGNASINANGTITYVPNENYYGNDSFIYEVIYSQGATDTATVYITINSVNDPPVVNFSFTPENPTDLDTIQFTDLSYDLDGYIVNYTWNFGDGSISYEQNPQHRYEDDGTYNVTLTVKDNDGAIATITKQIVVANAPPSTSCNIGGLKGKNGWYRSGVTITFFATDPEGDEINATYYRIGGGEWKVYHGGIIEINTEGIYQIEYYSEDIDGAKENVKTKVVKIAKSTPYTTVILDGTLGENNWYISPVEISFQRGGSPAGIAYTKYRIDGGEWKTYMTPFTVDEEGEHTIEFYSADMAGNVESIKSATFKIDILPPMVEVIYPNGGEELSGIVTIEWEANDTIDDSLTISLYYSSDNMTWHEIATDIENTGSYEWDVSNIEPGNYWIKVVAKDDAGHIGIDTSDDSFTILPTIPLSIEITKPSNFLYIMDRAIIRLPKPVIIGGITIEVAVEGNVNKLELQIDNEIKYVSNDMHTTYSWYYDEPTIGKHEIKAIAYDGREKAMDSIEAFFINLKL